MGVRAFVFRVYVCVRMVCVWYVYMDWGRLDWGRQRTVHDVDDDAELASQSAVVDEAHTACLYQSPVRLLTQCIPVSLPAPSARPYARTHNHACGVAHSNNNGIEQG